MAFKLAKKPTFISRVKVFTPNSKGGHDKSEFNGTFKLVSDMEELEDLRSLPQREVMERVLVGWNEFVDDDGNEIEFNEVTLQALLSDARALSGLRLAFWSNILKAPEKNV